MQLKTLVLISMIIMSACQLSAVSPDIRLPDWYKTEIGISEWQPEHGILGIKVSVQALKIPIQNISCQLFQDFDSSQDNQIRKRAILNPGDKAVFMFKLTAKAGMEKWIQCDLRAMPDLEGMKKLISTIKDKPLTTEILNIEANNLSKALPIGWAIPVFLTEDIAMSAVSENSFKPELAHNGRKYYIWSPPSGIGTGITKETFIAFNSAIKSGNLRSALAACDLLKRKLENQTQPLAFKKGAKENFKIPANVAFEFIVANHAILSEIIKPDAQVLSDLATTMKPSFARPFVFYNLALTMLDKKDNKSAKKYLQKALSDLPAWPQATKISNQLK